MTDETAQFLDDLKSKANCIDACHVSSFQCLRKTKSGERQQLRVELLDAGPNSTHGALRYQVVAMKPIDHSDTPEIGGNRMRYDKGQTVTNDKPLAQKVPQTKPY